MDKNFKNFLRSQSKALVIGVIALFAGLLILIGSVGTETDQQSEENLESRVAEMCSMTEGVGECRVMITYSAEGEVYAVAVVCDGAESAVVREKITSLMCALFGVGANRVEILKIKS